MDDETWLFLGGSKMITNEEFNYIGIDFKRCLFCDNFLSLYDTIPYCDYICNLYMIRSKKRSKN